MTDLELLELIQTKSPDELSVAELEALRQRLAASAELRREVALRVEMEQYLYQALARVDVSVDEIIGQAGSATSLGSGALRRMGLAAAAVAGIALGGLLIWAVAEHHATPEPTKPATGIAEAPVSPALPGDAKLVEEEQSGPSPSDMLLAATTNRDDDEGAPIATTAAAASAATSRAWEQSVEDADRTANTAPELYRTFDPRKLPFTADDLKQWFAPVEGHRCKIDSRDVDGARWSVMEGLWRLKAPLDPDTALRLTVLQWRDLKIHAWSGNRGTTIRYLGTGRARQWAGYTTLREDAAPIPRRLYLAATDEERFWKTHPYNPITVQLRYADGLLTLSAGDIRLLDIPMSVAPTEIYFEGTAQLRELAMVPAAKLPPATIARSITRTLSPATQSWTKPAEGTGTLIYNTDGSVELHAEKNTQAAVAKLAINRPGIAEFVLELQDPPLGTGICLLDTEGNPIYLAAFAENQAVGQLQVGSTSPDRPSFDIHGNPDEYPIPFPGGQVWVKLTLASGWVKLWISVDGNHFAGAGEPVLLEQAISGVGLFAYPHASARSLRLNQLTLHELDAINQLAPLEFRLRVSPLATHQSFADFRTAAGASRPADVDRDEWLRACAVCKLATGCSADLGDALIEYLWHDSAQMRLPFDQRLALLEQLSILAPTWNDLHLAERQLRYYEALGEELEAHGDTQSYSRIAARQLLAPVWSCGRFPFLPLRLVRHETLELAQVHQWDALTALVRRLEFLHIPEEASAVDFYAWLDSLANGPRAKSSDKARGSSLADWRHPLTTEFSKEGFNVLADLRVALESGAYRDACQVIGAANSRGMQGLLPDSEDPDLAVSLAATVALAMNEHPPFRETMADQFGPLGRLRVRQAIADRNTEAVEAATLQFYGTEAAAEAHLWLADRAISSGAFAAAQGHYRAARTTASPGMLPRLIASEQLAAALMGHDARLKPQGTIELGEMSIPASTFLGVADQLRTARATESGFGGTPAASPTNVRLPAPKNYTTTVRSRFEGEAGQGTRPVPREYDHPLPGRPELSVDWVAAQLSVLPLEDRILVSSRFQLASYDPASGALQWRAGLGGDMGRAHEWRLAPMRPLATSELAFVRRSRAKGPTLAAIALNDGSVKWETKLDGEHWVVSDPVLIGSTLYACTARHTNLGYVLSLGTFDPVTGVMLRERTLTDLRETWRQVRDCQMLPLAESFVITCGGAVLRCNLMGDLRWTRKQLWIPPAVDSGWTLQSHEPPRFIDNRLLVVQPCVPEVVALDPDNGRLLWRSGLTTARRILGADESHLFVATADGVTAIDVTTGTSLWNHPAVLLDGALFSKADGLLIATQEPTGDKDLRSVVLTWLDTNTGQPKQSCRLPAMDHRQPRFGPMLVHGDHFWAFYGKDGDETREIVEMTAE